MYKLELTAESPVDLVGQVIAFASLFKGVDLGAKEAPAPVAAMSTPEPQAPVITTAEREANEAAAPVHEAPAVPELAEVRKALNDLRQAKGLDEVKAVLADFGAANVQALKEEDYLGVIGSAQARMGG